MTPPATSVRDFYESFPCGGEGAAGDRRDVVLPWWGEVLAVEGASGRVLEVACGTGLDLERLSRRARFAWGIDGSARPLRTARSRLAGQHNVRLAEADAARLPFADQSFDGVWCIGALHHMPEWRSAIDEIARVLRPGGRFVFLVYRRPALQTVMFAIGRIIRPVVQRWLNANARTGRFKAAVAEFSLLPVVLLLPEGTWLDAVRRSGLRVERVVHKDPWFPLDRALPALRRSTLGEERFGRFLVVEARRPT